MSLPDFVSGVKILARISASEKLDEILVARTGSSSMDKKGLNEIWKVFELRTRDPKTLRRVQAMKERLAEKGINVKL